MRYHVVTHYGTSEQYYGDSNPYKVHGSGQGAGNSGMEWNFLSIPIMEMMEKTTEGCVITGINGETWEKI